MTPGRGPGLGACYDDRRWPGMAGAGTQTFFESVNYGPFSCVVGSHTPWDSWPVPIFVGASAIVEGSNDDCHVRKWTQARTDIAGMLVVAVLWYLLTRHCPRRQIASQPEPKDSRV